MATEHSQSTAITKEFLEAAAGLRRYPHPERSKEWLARLSLNLREFEDLYRCDVGDEPPILTPAAQEGRQGGKARGPTEPAAREASEALERSRSDALHDLDAVVLARRIRSTELSAVEVVDYFLERSRKNRHLNAYTTLLEEQARQDAQQVSRRLSQGEPIGPLAGVPVAVKDLMKIRGCPLTCGSRAFESVIPDRDAQVVERLRQAGAVIIGATNLHEFAYGVTSQNPHFGHVKNPVDEAFLPGGSSGGSAAAVAGGLAAAALGTDTGGSVRIPAACTGIVGLKPTYGRVSLTGVFPLSWSLDHVGPMTRSVSDAALLLQVMGGPLHPDRKLAPDGLPARLNGDLKGLRIATVREYFASPVDPQISAAMAAALAGLREAGATLAEVSIPSLVYAPAAQFFTLTSEATNIHWERLKRRGELYGPDVRVRLEIGQFIFSTDYIQAQRLRNHITREFLEIFRSVDALVTPTLPCTVPRINDSEVSVGEEKWPAQTAMTRFTLPFNMTGLPAITLPWGRDERGLPIGIQVAGRPWEEWTILRAARALERLRRD
jgi:AtzE family amidohydrolase